MKFNLKNPLWEDAPWEARQGFEKEIREMKSKLPLMSAIDEIALIKEILGE